MPAYAQFLSDNDYVFRILELDAFPETTKENYVQRYPFAERCRHGRIPIAGTVVDESAGSSGTPFNWLRSERELRDVHLNTANWMRFTFPTERLFAINAFSMGAWATGTNMGIALSKVAMVKSTGPDLAKIVDTIELFGDEYDYLITAYPPFLKHVVDCLDERGFDWDRTRVYGAVGGEGMTEAMRDYLERRLVKVRSGYGASDVQIGIAGETDLSVWVRKLLVERADVREALLGADERRIPMVFQYNPLENYIEINEASDAVVTLNNLSVLAPKLRYNVGDEGLTMTRADVLGRLAALGVDRCAAAPSGELGSAVLLPVRPPRRNGVLHGCEHLPDRRRVRPVSRRGTRGGNRELLPRALGVGRARVAAGGARANARRCARRASASRRATARRACRVPGVDEPRLRGGGSGGPRQLPISDSCSTTMPRARSRTWPRKIKNTYVIRSS